MSELNETNLGTSDEDISKDAPEDAIAIIGMAGRIPGADTLSEFWRNLKNGTESISHFSDDELQDNFSDEERAQDNFVKARSVLENVDMFDAEFFDMFPNEAALTDPQHRLFLECSWEALEDSGYDPAAYEGAIGVFAGSSMNSYFQRHVCGEPGEMENFTSHFQVGKYAHLLAGIQDIMTTRVSYKLDLRGPSINLGTACSTSLSAIVQACQSLLLYQSDMALAGGVSITFPQQRGYFYQEGGMASKDGRLRSFDADAKGTVFGSGAGVVLLKRLDEALEDNDHIYAVIRGFGINNDGAAKAGFAAPSVDQQAAAIASAHAMADISSDTVDYVECHGTGTPLGDPIEFTALVKAFRETSEKTSHCALGSAKPNIGHLDAAAGVVGLMKTALCLENREIPALLHFKTANPRLPLDGSPFTLGANARPWPAKETPRRAGVSAFGVGGTNVHIVMEEAPASNETDNSVNAGKVPVLLPISAKSEKSATDMNLALADFLETHKDASLHDVAYTLQTGRRAFGHRTSLACTDKKQAISLLRKSKKVLKASPQEKLPVVFMFPGQGSQYPGMGKELYEQVPLFRSIFEQGAKLLQPIIDVDLVDLCYGDIPTDDDSPHPIRSTVLAQPALFLVEYALARVLMSQGLTPDAMIGHSVGEYVAACVAGVMSFEEGLKLVSERARLMQDQPEGAMLSVRLPRDEVEPYLEGTSAEIAAINAPGLCVVSGEFAQIEIVEQKLVADGVLNKRLHTSHAFHSAMMDGAIPELTFAAEKINFNAPQIPYISCVSGDWATDDEATSADYWARHCRNTVLFQNGLEALAKKITGDPQASTKNKDSGAIFVEVGPGRVLATLSAQTLPRQSVRLMRTTLPEFADRGHEHAFLYETIGQLWAAGLDLDWSKFREGKARRISIPTYQFDRQRHWIEAPADNRTSSGKAQQAINSEQLSPPPNSTNEAITDPNEMEHHRHILQTELMAMLKDLSGKQIEPDDTDVTFLELGYDSLFLGQFAQLLQRQYKTRITFRQLFRELSSVDALAAHLADIGPVAAPVEQPTAPIQAAPVQAAPATPQIDNTMAPSAVAMPMATSAVQEIFRDQLAAMQQLMGQQLALLQGDGRLASNSEASPSSVRPTQQANEASLPPFGSMEEAKTIAPQQAQVDEATAHLNEEDLPDTVPLTEPQTEILLASLLDEDAYRSYNELFSLKLKGKLDHGLLERSMNEIIARHDSLRATIHKDSRTMRVAPRFTVEMPLIDLTDHDNPLEEHKRLIHKQGSLMFDLENGPLVRTLLIRMKEDEHIMVFNGQHIIVDAWSVSVIMKEIGIIYSARLEGREPDLQPAMSFRQYALEQDDLRQKGYPAEKYWLDQFKTIPERPDIPTDRPRPARRELEAGTYTSHFDPELYHSLKDISAKSGNSLFSTLFANLQIMLGRFSNNQDVVMLMAIAGQNRVDRPLVGHCVNFLPVKKSFRKDMIMGDHVEEIADHMLDILENQEYTYGTLVRNLDIPFDPAHLPITDLHINLVQPSEVEFPGLEAVYEPDPMAYVNFDLFFHFGQTRNDMRFDIFYCKSLYDETTIKRWVDHLMIQLRAFVDNSSRRIDEMPLLSEQQNNWLRDDLNRTQKSFSRNSFIHELIEEQARQTPDHTALVCDGVEMSYRQLDERANQIARHLREILGNQQGRIAVAMDRSLELASILLGVLKAGLTYVPLDPEHPQARLRQTMQTAELLALVCTDKEIASLAPAGVTILQTDLETKNFDRQSSEALDCAIEKSSARQPAYVIFTSGSTGTPKGVEVPHKAVVNFMQSMAQKPGFTTSDTIVAVTSISFDIAALEIFLPLISGGRSVIASRAQVKDGFALVELILHSQTTILQATPTLWRILLEAGLKNTKSIKGLKMLCGGEALPRDLADELLGLGGELWNMYGPTETTIWSSIAKIEKEDGPVTIGAPINNTQLYILDASDRLAPIGITGELYIGGDGLALGYFNQPELTGKMFREVSINGAPPQRLYNTGDVGKRLPDGSIQLLGRKDQQIKLRGFRIELEEIEAHLRQAPDIAGAAVALHTRTGGIQHLVGYYVPAIGTHIETQKLSSYLTAKLPNYMVPTLWQELDKLPVTGNGKLDRNKLPEPDQSAAAKQAENTPPKTDLEKQLASIWNEVLSIDNIGTNSNLFALGADSLHMFRIAARMKSRNLGLDARHLLQYPTIAELAQLCLSRQAEGDVQLEQASPPSLSSFARGSSLRRGAK